MISNNLNLHSFSILLFTLTILHRVDSVSDSCQLSFKNRNKLYDYNLANPIRNFPHGVLSEDGFYKVVGNETVLWFQLCDQMIFNQNPPSCADCKGCGGSSHHIMGCSALVTQNIGGYPVCTAIGHPSSTATELIDVRNPKIGVIVIMSGRPPAQNCSLKVSVICDYKHFQAPQTIEKMGACDFVTELRHPSGCAYIISHHGKGWGWFGTLLMIILCVVGAYLISGAVYRHYHLGIRGIDVIPNLDFWVSLPHRAQSYVMSIVRRYRGPSEGYRSSYNPVNFGAISSSSASRYPIH